MVKELTANGAALDFSQKGAESQVYLTVNGVSKPIGQNVMSTLVERLLAFLERRSDIPETTHEDGKRWRWVLTTACPYTFVFGRETPAGFALKIWNGEAAQREAEFEITRHEADGWIAKLRNWLPEKQVATGG